MTDENIIAICLALISIVEHECCDYGFTDQIEVAEIYLREKGVIE